jgi:replication factor C large subunit
MSAARKAIQNCDKDPDDVFWWVENNIPYEFTDAESLANAYDILSKADLLRQKVMQQQNWRFRMHMIDMLSGISLAGEASHDYIQYKSPDRFAMLARLRFSRAEMGAVFGKLSAYTHTSEKVVKNSYIPYLKIILSGRFGKKESDAHGVELTAEEAQAIVG